MLVTFRTKAWSSITMFGEVAKQLLLMAGHGGSIPGAFDAEGVARAHENLTRALTTAQAQMRDRPAQHQKEADEDDASNPVDLALRLGVEHPLVHLLAAAARQGSEVTWSEGADAI